MSLASYMIESGLTDGELAATLGVSAELVRLWRVGRRRITAERAVAISQETKIPLHELRADLWPEPTPIPAPAPRRRRSVPEAAE